MIKLNCMNFFFYFSACFVLIGDFLILSVFLCFESSVQIYLYLSCYLLFKFVRVKGLYKY